MNRGWAHRASALVVIVSRTQWVPPGKTEVEPLRSHSFDAGAAWASIAFQATLSGWHVHGIGGFDRDRVRASLAIPDDHAVEAVVAIGRQGDPRCSPMRSGRASSRISGTRLHRWWPKGGSTSRAESQVKGR